MYNRFTVFVTNDWLWEFFVPRHGSNRVQYGCMHVSSPFDFFISHSTGRYAAQYLAYDGLPGSYAPEINFQ
jgi:hypothetical protein